MATDQDFKTPPEKAEWWVCWNGDQKGPLSFKQVRQWLKEGKITRDSFVKQGSNGKWELLAKAGVVPDLEEIFRSINTAAVWLLIAEMVFFSVIYPPVIPWCLGSVLVYVWLYYKTFWLPKIVARFVRWVKYYFF